MERMYDWKFLTTVQVLCGNTALSEENRVKKIIEYVSEWTKTADFSLIEQIRAWLRDISGTFLVQSVTKDLEIVTKRDKANLRKILQRLRNEKAIVRVGTKYDQYRKVDDKAAIIEWWKIDPKKLTPLDIKFPLEVHKHAEIYPKNSILITGANNQGKSGFCMRTALMNANKFDIDYYSNEMGDIEFAKRMYIANLSEEEKNIFIKKVKVVERSYGYEEIIDPNKFSIIDYLTSPGGEAYSMKDYVEAITNKLERGICLIAAHKWYKTDKSYGGERMQDRPRLSIAIEDGVAKLLKVKNWATIDNPNGKIVKFKLVGGMKFIMEGVWHTEDSEEALRKSRIGSGGFRT